ARRAGRELARRSGRGALLDHWPDHLEERRLLHAVLPRRAAGDPAGGLRGRAARRRQPVAAAALCDAAVSAPHAGVRAGDRAARRDHPSRPYFHFDQGRPVRFDQPAAVLHLSAGGRTLRPRQGGVRDRGDAGAAACADGALAASAGAQCRGARMTAKDVRAALRPSRLLIGALALAWAVPFLWMLVAAFRPERVGGAGMASLVPAYVPTLANFAEAWDSADFVVYYLNTIIICAGILAVQLVTISLAGYAF